HTHVRVSEQRDTSAITVGGDECGGVERAPVGRRCTARGTGVAPALEGLVHELEERVLVTGGDHAAPVGRDPAALDDHDAHDDEDEPADHPPEAESHLLLLFPARNVRPASVSREPSPASSAGPIRGQERASRAARAASYITSSGGS